MGLTDRRFLPKNGITKLPTDRSAIPIDPGAKFLEVVRPTLPGDIPERSRPNLTAHRDRHGSHLTGVWMLIAERQMAPGA